MMFVYVVKGEEHANLCKISADSIRRFHPEADIVVYVDQFYDILDEASVFQSCRQDLFDYPIMVTGMLCRNEAMADASTGDVLCFVDTDCILVNKIDALPLKSADMAVTWRTHETDPTISKEVAKAMPYNTGVIFARATAASRHAFEFLVRTVMEFSPQLKNWYGDQHAMRALVGPLDIDAEYVGRKVDYFDITFRMLPCTKWNYTPPGDEVDTEGKVFIHFKGKRKDQMRAFAA